MNIFHSIHMLRTHNGKMSGITLNRIISSCVAHCHNQSLNTSDSPERRVKLTLHEHAPKPPVCPEFMFQYTGTAPYWEVAPSVGTRKGEGGWDDDDLGVSRHEGF